MKKYFLLFCTAISNTLFACDFCGCYMGITPYDNHSNVSLLYRYKSYNGYYYTGQHHNLFPKSYTTSNTTIYTSANQLKHGSHTTNPSKDTVRSQKDFEIFSTIELRAKFFIHKRIEISGILPFVMNKQREFDSTTIHTNGIGDITLLAAYHLISKIMTEGAQHRLIIGGGIKLPVADYYLRDKNNKRIDYMLQPGTGSIDYLAYINYVGGIKRLGVNFNSTVKLNGENYYHEQIGNSSTNYLNLFYKFRQDKDFKIFPSIQGYYEYTKGLYINDIYQEGTTMNIFSSGIGLDVFYKNVALNLSFQLPVYEERFKNNMGSGCRAMAGITYSFNQKKYLLNRKKEKE